MVLREESENALALMRWGLVPSWARDEKSSYKMINARLETVGERPSYREPLQSRRCLVPANWFFEWKPERVGPKTPYVIRRKVQVRGREKRRKKGTATHFRCSNPFKNQRFAERKWVAVPFFRPSTLLPRTPSSVPLVGYLAANHRTAFSTILRGYFCLKTG